MSKIICGDISDRYKYLCVLAPDHEEDHESESGIKWGKHKPYDELLSAGLQKESAGALLRMKLFKDALERMVRDYLTPPKGTHFEIDSFTLDTDTHKIEIGFSYPTNPVVPEDDGENPYGPYDGSPEREFDMMDDEEKHMRFPGL